MFKYILFKCYDCGEYNVFPVSNSDGNSCVQCGGRLLPVGNAYGGKFDPWKTHKLFICDPTKNEPCKKTDCKYLHPCGKCYMTNKSEYALDGCKPLHFANGELPSEVERLIYRCNKSAN